MPSKLARSRQRVRRKQRRAEARMVADAIQRLKTTEHSASALEDLDVIQDGVRRTIRGYVTEIVGRLTIYPFVDLSLSKTRAP